MKVRAILSLRNEAIVAGLERLGVNQAQLAEIAGVSPNTISAVARMQFRKVSEAALLKVAIALGVDLDTLAPSELRRESLTVKHELTREVPTRALLGIAQGTILLEDKDAPMAAEEMRTAIDAVLDELAPRERKVIRLRFGLGGTREHTLEEVAKVLRVTRERVRQIEAHAIRRLRHPPRVRKILSASEGLDRGPL